MENPSQKAAKGLTIIGVGHETGKTVLMTGLACVLKEEGLTTKAVKPICLGNVKSCQAELAFISSISQTSATYPVQYMREPGCLKPFQYEDALRVSSKGTDFTLVELPGSAAFPLASMEEKGAGWKDTANFASDLGFPCLLVGKLEPEVLEKFVLNSSYLAGHGLDVIGLALVDTDEHSPYARENFSEEAQMALQEYTGVPYLGLIAHSQSISVPEVNQGNLIKTTAQALDLLPLLKSLNLCLSSV